MSNFITNLTRPFTTFFSFLYPSTNPHANDSPISPFTIRPDPNAGFYSTFYSYLPTTRLPSIFCHFHPPDPTVLLLPTYSPISRAHPSELRALQTSTHATYFRTCKRLGAIRSEVWRALDHIDAREIKPISAGGTIFDLFYLKHENMYTNSGSSVRVRSIPVFSIRVIEESIRMKTLSAQILALEDAIANSLPRAHFEMLADAADATIGTLRARVGEMVKFAARVEQMQWECGTRGLLDDWYLGVTAKAANANAEGRDEWDVVSEDVERGLIACRYFTGNENADADVDAHELVVDEEARMRKQEQRQKMQVLGVEFPLHKTPGYGVAVAVAGAKSKKPVLTLQIPLAIPTEIVDLGYIHVGRPQPQSKPKTPLTNANGPFPPWRALPSYYQKIPIQAPKRKLSNVNTPGAEKGVMSRAQKLQKVVASKVDVARRESTELKDYEYYEELEKKELELEQERERERNRNIIYSTAAPGVPVLGSPFVFKPTKKRSTATTTDLISQQEPLLHALASPFIFNPNPNSCKKWPTTATASSTSSLHSLFSASSYSSTNSAGSSSGIDEDILDPATTGYPTPIWKRDQLYAFDWAPKNRKRGGHGQAVGSVGGAAGGDVDGMGDDDFSPKTVGVAVAVAVGVGVGGEVWVDEGRRKRRCVKR